MRRPLSVLLSVFAMSVCLVTPAAADGQTYHVAPGGDDGARGAADAPWRTLDASLPRLRPGDTLYVHGGVYDEEVTIEQGLAVGTAEQPIRVVAWPTERPVVRGMLRLRDMHWWEVDGINVTHKDGVTPDGENLVKLLGGSNWTFRDAEVWGARASAGILVGETGLGAPADWRITGVCVHGTVPTNGWGRDHNLYVTNGADAGAGTIERSVFFGAPNGANVKLGPPSNTSSGQSNVVLRSSTMAHAQQNVLIAYTAHDNVVERNVMDRGPQGYGKPWYPNVRGFDVSGARNVVRDNVGFRAEAFTLDNPETEPGVVDAGGNELRPGAAFAGSGSCDGMRPTGAAAGFGRYAPAGGQKTDPDDRLRRVDGNDRIETALAVSRVSYPEASTVGAVVLARADTYPDALAGAPLAASLGAPLLLTDGRELDRRVAKEITRLGPDRVVVLGGAGAISEGVVRALRGLGPSVERMNADTRHGTAAAIARALSAQPGADPAHAYVVLGEHPDPRNGWPDAVSVSFLAASTGRPILLTGSDALPDETVDALDRLGTRRVTIVGGRAAVAAPVVSALQARGLVVDRVSGADRFATSRAVVDQATAWSGGPLWVATGRNFPDALAAGGAVAAAGGVMLLVDGGEDGLGAPARGWVRANAQAISEVAVVGGHGVVSDGIEDELRRWLPM